MNIQNQHFQFKLLLDKVDSENSKNMLPHQIDWLLNEATQVFIKQRMGITNNKRMGFEVSQKRIDDLKTLVVKCPTSIQPAVAVQSLGNGMYELDLANTNYDYQYMVRLTALAEKEGCTDKVVKCVPVQHDDLTEALSSTEFSPSFLWGEVPVVYGQSNSSNGEGSVYFYTNSLFTVSVAYPEYIRKPRKVWLGTYDLTTDLKVKSASNSYVYQSGVTSPVDSDLPEYTHSEIVDIAVQLASMATHDVDYAKLYSEKTLINE